MSSSFIGKVVDNYRIIENLGIGGMGVVFRAIHVKLDKMFALKMIAPGLAMNENFIKRFQTEARALAKFEDPNIVRIYDLREHDDQWFIVMEYVDGINLLDIIRKEGAFPLQNALSMLKQILTAMGHAHSAGIIHRDLKPNNVMISTTGNVKITDFGLAKDQSSMTTTLTVTSGGTLYYMSPEHVKGFQYTDERSDIYSIGMTFYEMITGTVPFKDLQSDFDIRESIMRKDTVKPSSYNEKIPPELEAIVMKAIAKKPEDRYQTTNDMLEAIKQFEANDPDIDSDFSLVEIPQKSQSTESEFKFGKVPDPTVTDVAFKIKNRRKYIGIFSALIVGCLILLFIFYPSNPGKKRVLKTQAQLSQLSITTNPPSAEIILADSSIGSTPIKNYSLKPGEYSLKIAKTDFLTVDTSIILKAGNNVNLSVPLRALSIKPDVDIVKRQNASKKNPKVKTTVNAAIRINSKPSNAEVWINNRLKGNTPLNISNISPGEHRFTLKKDGFSDYSKQYNLTSGKNNDVLINLTPIVGELYITTDPSSATIFLDGVPLDNSKTPASFKNIPAGDHIIEIKKAGYATVSKDIIIKEGETLKTTIILTQLTGKLSVQVRPWGEIFINDVLKKESADTKYEVSLPVEEYKLKVSHPTLGIWEKNVKIEPDAEKEIIVNFNRQIKVNISAFDEEGLPLAADIIIDDEPTGKKTPAEINTRVGIRNLKLNIEGYNTSSQVMKIFVDKNEKNEHTIILKK